MHRTNDAWSRSEGSRGRRQEEFPGIMIADGGVGSSAQARRPRISAFIWAERDEDAPTLPFGRWKPAS